MMHIGDYVELGSCLPVRSWVADKEKQTEKGIFRVAQSINGMRHIDVELGRPDCSLPVRCIAECLDRQTDRMAQILWHSVKALKYCTFRVMVMTPSFPCSQSTWLCC